MRLSTKFVSVDFGALLSQFALHLFGIISTFVYYPKQMKRKLAKMAPKSDENQTS